MARHQTTARLAAANHLLTWLTDKGLALADCRQPHLDTYLVEHPRRRDHLYGFLAWVWAIT